MHAPPKPDYPNFEPAQMEEFDAFLFGIPTRYGNMPAQLKTFWDATGQIWQKGTLDGKYAGTFVSCSSAGGGTEMTALNMMSTFVHHGLIYVPLGYKNTFAQISSNSEVRGGSAWGAGTFAVGHIAMGNLTFLLTISQGDGSRQPTPLEMELAEIQGKTFWEKVSRVNF